MTQDIATLGIAIDSRQVAQAGVSLDELAVKGAKAEGATKSLSSATDILARVYRDVASAALTWKVAEYIKDAAMLQARYETLGVSMTVVGRNAGYTGAQMDAAARGMQAMGISMVESRQQAMRLVQAHISLADSQKLARIAQDAAFIGNMNSSEAFAAMIHGIQTGQTEVLRMIGLNISMEQAYKQMAATLHKNVDALSQNEKTQGVLNAVMSAGADIAGTYEAAMDTAGKQINSMKRYTEDLKVIQGEVFNEALTVGVMAYTAHLKEATEEQKSLAAGGELRQFGKELTDIFVTLADTINNALGAVKLLATGAAWGVTRVQAFIQYQRDSMAAGLDVEKEQAAFAKYRALVDANNAELGTAYDKIIATEDRFTKALAERRAAQSKSAAGVAAEEKERADAIATYQVNLAAAYQAGTLTLQQYLAAASGAQKATFGDNHLYGDATAAVKAHNDAYQNLLKSLREKLVMAQAELAQDGKLTDAQKLEAEISAKLVEIKKQHPGISTAAAQALLKETKATLDANDAKERWNKLQSAAEQAYVDAYDKRLSSVAQYENETRAMRDSTAEIGLSADALLVLRRARIDDTIASEERQLRIFTEGGIESETTRKIRESIAALKDRKVALGEQTAATVALDQMKEQADMWKKLEDTGRQTFVSWADGAKDFATRARDSLKNILFDWLWQQTARKFFINLVASTAGTGVATQAFGASSVGSASGSMFGSAAVSGFASMAGEMGTWMGGAGNGLVGLLADAGITNTAALSVAQAVPVIAAATVAIVAVSKLFSNGGTPSSNTGDIANYYSAGGAINRQTTAGGSTPAVDAFVASMESAYQATAKALGIGTVAHMFSLGTNSGENGANPRTLIFGGAGTQVNSPGMYASGEIASSDKAAIELAVQRAFLAAIQGSAVPEYLRHVFDGLTPSTATMDQINAATSFAAQLKQVRDALIETRTPLQILQDNVTAATAALHTSGETFKRDFVAAIDSGMSPEQLATWQALGVSLDQLAQTSGDAAKAVDTVTRSLADIASEHQRLQDQYDALTMSEAQLAEKARNAIDASNLALYDQVQAAQAAKTAAAELAQAQRDTKAAADAAAADIAARTQNQATAENELADARQKSLDVAMKAVADTMAAVTRAVRAERDSITSTYNDALQSNADNVKKVTDSMAKLSSLSGALKSSLSSIGVGPTRSEAQAQIAAALAIAKAGGALPTADQLQPALAAIAQPSEGLFSSFTDYQRDFVRTANDIRELDRVAGSQTAVQQTTLNALTLQTETLKAGYGAEMLRLDSVLSQAQAQVDAINGVDNSVQTVTAAVLGLSAALMAAGVAKTAIGTIPKAPSADPVTAAYQQYFGRSPDSAGLAYWQSTGLTGAALDWNILHGAAADDAAAAHMRGYADGSNYITHDQIAQVHAGEEITPRPYVDMQRAARDETNALLRRLIDSNTALRAETAAARAELGDIKRTNKTIADITQKSDAIGPAPARAVA